MFPDQTGIVITDWRRKGIKHGTPAGYQAHRRRSEPACQECKDASAAYQAERKRSIRGRTPLTC